MFFWSIAKIGDFQNGDSGNVTYTDSTSKCQIMLLVAYERQFSKLWRGKMFPFMTHVQANAFVSYNNYTVSPCTDTGFKCFWNKQWLNNTLAHSLCYRHYLELNSFLFCLVPSSVWAVVSCICWRQVKPCTTGPLAICFASFCIQQRKCSCVHGFHLTHEYSRVEIFSFGEKESELFALYPVTIFDISPKIADMLESKLKSPICLVAFIRRKRFSAASLSTNKYLVVLCFGSALPVFKWKQQETHKEKGKLSVFPLTKQSLKLHVICGEGWEEMKVWFDLHNTKTFWKQNYICNKGRH